LQCLKLLPLPTTIRNKAPQRQQEQFTSFTRICAYSLVCLACVVAAFFVQPHSSLAKQNTDPQTPEQIRAQDAFYQGVQAFQNGQYEEALQQFSYAKHLDPTLVKARLYLATTYASQYIPGALSEENRQKGEAGVAEFRELLKTQPDNIAAIDGIGSLLFMMAGQELDSAMFNQSKSFHQRHIQIRPEDPEPYYWIGVINWTLAFRANGKMREVFNQSRSNELAAADPLPDDLREQYARAYGPAIGEGIDSLKRAIELKPEYADAMAYLSLLYRRQADTVVTTTERQDLTKMADDLLDKIREIKQRQREHQAQ
jgi:tetratricopeptide (TPR) repeat protein